jgi:HTH-type transcriptional repressor of NAD biosynthesis genes
MSTDSISKQAREHPFRHWESIPVAMRPDLVKRICFYGPESTGKSTMAKRMAARYHTDFVPEVSREIISSNSFTEKDILLIGRAQTERVLAKTRTANRILFCDSDLITTQIYSDVYLHRIPPELTELEKQITYHQHFLFDIDVPWVADGLRDLGDRRPEMFQRFKRGLENRGISYILLSGTHEEREQRVIQYVDELLGSG